MKNSKKGISLIVLVITIIVIIILAAAIILTLNKNNPIEEANDARYASDTANMQAILTNVVAKVMAEKQSVITISQNTQVSNTSNLEFSFDSALDGTSQGRIIFNTKPTNTADIPTDKPTWYTGKTLPEYSSGTTIWVVDTEGNIHLKVGDKEYPKGVAFPAV